MIFRVSLTVHMLLLCACNVYDLLFITVEDTGIKEYFKYLFIHVKFFL